MNRNYFAYSASLLATVGLLSLVSYAQSDSPYPGDGSSPGASPSPGTSASPNASPSPSAVTVQTKNGALGTYLTDGQGKSLYLFDADTSGVSNCNGACLQVWPALTIQNGQTPQVGGSATNNLISTITRSDGSKQVTYNGWPLYYYIVDKNPDDTTGQGVDSFGAKWWLIKPDGTKLQ